MSTILGLDLGEFKSVACLHDTDTTAARFATIATDPDGLRTFLGAERPGLVVFETCTVAGWVADTCDELKVPYAVADPMHEAWIWRKVRRKTDRDDALKRRERPSFYQMAPAAAGVRCSARLGFLRRRSQPSATATPAAEATESEPAGPTAGSPIPYDDRPIKMTVEWPYR